MRTFFTILLLSILFSIPTIHAQISVLGPILGKGFDPVPRKISVPPSSNTFSKGNAQFIIDYVNESQFPIGMVAAVEQATLLWSEILTSDVPIRIKVELDIAETTQMMACWPHMSLYAPDNVNFNWYSSALANKLAGVDLDPTS